MIGFPIWAFFARLLMGAVLFIFGVWRLTVGVQLRPVVGGLWFSEASGWMAMVQLRPVVGGSWFI